MSKEIQPSIEVGPATELLSRAECNIMRGFAILLIVINNFTHMFKDVVKDCEYNFY